MRTLDHKVVEIVENVPLACIEEIYLSGRKAHICPHVVDGTLPRAIHMRGQVKFSVQVKGDCENETEFAVWPSVFVCADCLADFLANAGVGTRLDLATDYLREG